MKLESGCWTFLGLEDATVSSVAVTEWGLFAGTRRQGVFRYKSASNTWQALGLDQAVVRDLAFAPGDPGLLFAAMAPYDENTLTEAAVFATADTGRTWVPSDGGYAARKKNKGSAFSLAVDPWESHRLYWGRDVGVVLRSEDRGRTWAYVLGDDNVWGGALERIVVSASDGRVWAGGWDAFSLPWVGWSDDQGETWSGSGTRPPEEKEVRVERSIYDLWPDPEDPRRVLAATLNGVLRSADHGATWDRVLNTVLPGAVRALAHVEGRVYALSDEQDWSGGPPPAFHTRLYVSRNRGESWRPLAVPETIASPFDRAIAVQEGALVLGTSAGVWRFLPR